MFLRFSFTVLLTSLLLALNVPDAGAAPLQHRQPKGMVTMPLRRLESNRANIHPQILLQQQINRSKKRLALMTDCAQPSEHELRSAIEKRMSLLSNDPLANATVVDKRFNHSGTHRNEGRTKRFNQAGTHRQHTRDFDSFRKAQNDGAQVVTVTVTAGAEPTPAAGNVNNDTPAASVPGSGNNNGNGVKGGANAGSGAGAAAGQNPGPTPAEIKAAQDNGVTAAEQPTASNSLGLEIFSNDVGYLGEVQIGTPPRTFTILMDSGSADFWVGADNCVSTSGGGCGNKNFLGSKESSSFVDSGVPFQVTYGTGAVAGSKITDNVVLAGLQLNTLDFGVAQQETPDFSADNVAFDGLMGLAQSTLSNQQVPTPVEKLKAQGLIKQAITSYKLGRVADGKNDGEITFGGLDTTRFDPASLAELDNVSKVGFWEAAMDAVSVNGADLGLQGRKAILDTGTTLILAPVDDATKVHQAIKGAKSDGQGGFIVPCTTTDVVELTFGGKQFSIDPRDLAFAPLDPNDPTGDCVSGISAGNIGDATEWLVGDTFLKSVYFSHNVDTNTMSLAKLK